MANNSPTVDIKAFLGLRNTANSRRLPVGALTVAENVDIDDEGMVVSRNGYALALVLSSCTAAYAPSHHQFAYIVDGGNLFRIDDGLNKALLGAVSSESLHFAEAGDFVFVSDGSVIVGDRLLNWRVLPPSMPVCRVTGGYLTAGIYQLLMTRITDDGRESASSEISILELPDNSGIQIENASGHEIYVTEPNGTVFYRVGTGINLIEDASRLSVAIDNDLVLGESLPESIDCIAFYDSCMAFSRYDQLNKTSFIGWSKPFRWHVFDLFNDYIQVPGEVRLLLGLPDKLIIGTERNIYSYDGESLVTLAQYGVPHGYNAAQSQNGFHLIYTNRGVCAVDQFANLTHEKVSLAPGEFCSTAFVEQSGIEKFIILTDATGTANNSV